MGPKSGARDLRHLSNPALCPERTCVCTGRALRIARRGSGRPPLAPRGSAQALDRFAVADDGVVLVGKDVVVAGSAPDRVLLVVACVDGVVARGAIEQVGAGAAGECVVARAAVQLVLAASRPRLLPGDQESCSIQLQGRTAELASARSAVASESRNHRLEPTQLPRTPRPQLAVPRAHTAWQLRAHRRAPGLANRGALGERERSAHGRARCCRSGVYDDFRCTPRWAASRRSWNGGAGGSLRDRGRRKRLCGDVARSRALQRTSVHCCGSRSCPGRPRQ